MGHQPQHATRNKKEKQNPSTVEEWSLNFPWCWFLQEIRWQLGEVQFALYAASETKDCQQKKKKEDEGYCIHLVSANLSEWALLWSCAPQTKQHRKHMKSSKERKLR